MAIIEDRDVAIWVCPYGDSNDVIEFVIGAEEPEAKVCGLHGEPFHKGCPRAACSHPTYHVSDLDQNFHKPCGEKIPWAQTRGAHFEAIMEYEPFHSRLIGTGSYPGKLKPTDPTEPAIVSAPEGPSRNAGRAARGELGPTQATGATWGQLEGMGTTWDDLGDTKLVRVGKSTATPAVASKRWWYGLSVMGKWVVGILGATIAGVLVLLIWNWLGSAGVVRP